MTRLQAIFRRFAKDDRGTASIEFVLTFPIFFGFFLMTYESGMIAAKHVMLERGVDMAVREVRIGLMPNPTRAQLRTRICEVAMIIPDCVAQLDIEMVQRDPRAWVNLSNTIECIDRGKVVQEEIEVDPTANNQLMVLRVCARIDPLLPTSGIGKAIAQANSGDAAGGSTALVSKAAFVVEPFRPEDDV